WALCANPRKKTRVVCCIWHFLYCQYIVSHSDKVYRPVEREGSRSSKDGQRMSHGRLIAPTPITTSAGDSDTVR
ncbi:hypothetical protein J6590_038318, partial [Homalodisca vitripennis]